MYSAAFDQPTIASSALVRALLRQAAAQADGQRFTERFLFGEWSDVVDAWQLKSWGAYRGVARLGRKTRRGGTHAEARWALSSPGRTQVCPREGATRPSVFAATPD